MSNQGNLRNFKSFTESIDLSHPDKLEITTHDKWVTVHPVNLVLAVTDNGPITRTVVTLLLLNDASGADDFEVDYAEICENQKVTSIFSERWTGEGKVFDRATTIRPDGSAIINFEGCEAGAGWREIKVVAEVKFNGIIKYGLLKL